MSAMKSQDAQKQKRRPEPTGYDWRYNRAQYLIETGRADQLKAENLEDFVPRRKAKGANA